MSEPATDPVADLSSFYAAIDKADEIEAAWNDPAADWGYQWEHLGDAERDIRILIDGLREALAVFRRV